MDHIVLGPRVVRAMILKRGIFGMHFGDCGGKFGLWKSRKSALSFKKSRKLGKGKCERLRIPSWDADLE